MNEKVLCIEGVLYVLVVCVGGGLGNQMFQYAFYKALCKQYPDTQVTMDIYNVFDEDLHNGYELGRVFNLNPERTFTSHGAVGFLV